MKNEFKKVVQKVWKFFRRFNVKELSVALVGLFMSGLMLVSSYNFSAGNWQANVFRDLFSGDSPEELYEQYFSVLEAGTTEWNVLSDEMIEKYQQYFSNDLRDVSYAYTAAIVGIGSATDCDKIYFGGGKGRAIVSLLGTNRLNSEYERWLLHELAHTEQCSVYEGGRDEYIETWFGVVPVELMKGKYINFQKIHEMMPTEAHAESKVDYVISRMRYFERVSQ